MANTIPIVHKRTAVSGRLPEAANTANTRYIYPGELSINLTDKKVHSSNGSVIFEVGANVSTLNVGSILANGSLGTDGYHLMSNGTAVYWSDDRGYTGSVGFTGSQGIIGFTGSLGSLGYTGSIGFTGSTGFTGSRGTVTSSDSAPISPTPGLIWYDSTTGKSYFWYVDGTSDQWVLFADPTVTDGIDGYTGSQGSAGYTGSTGYTGSGGYTGSAGTNGFTGSAGTNGFTGSVGFTGSAGTNGFTGSAGAGFTGSAGATGFTGSQGDIGFTGSTGFTGSNGTTYIGSTAPVSPANGDTWWDSDDGIRYVYYNDGNTSQWVQESAVGPQGPIGYTGSAGRVTLPVGFFFTSTPLTDETLLLYTAVETFAFANNFGGSAGDVGTNPTSSFVLTVQKNGANVGNVTISTGGSFTFDSGNTIVSMTSGDQLKIRAPSVADATVADVSITLKGSI